MAASFLREQCPEPPTRLLVGGELNWELASIKRIACARIWGKHPDRVIAQIRREWPTLAPEDTGEQSCRYPVKEFEDYARIDPPLTLSR